MLPMQKPLKKVDMRFAEGDIVTIAAKVISEDGWQNSWMPYMDKYVGNGIEYEVYYVNSKGVKLKECSSGDIIFVDYSGDVAVGFPHGSLKLI